MRLTDSVEWWRKLREIVQETMGPGTFLGDYLCVVSRSRPQAERSEALLRLSTRLLGIDDVSAQAAVLFAISRARDAEPQTVRFGKLWVLDRDGLKLKFVPVHQWRLNELATFEDYLGKIAQRELADDDHDVHDHVIEPFVIGPKRPLANIDIEETSASPEEVIASADTLRKLLASLSAQEREVFGLAAYGLPSDEICADVGIRPGTLKSVQHRIRKKYLRAL
jgi:hypothetical protein